MARIGKAKKEYQWNPFHSTTTKKNPSDETKLEKYDPLKR